MMNKEEFNEIHRNLKKSKEKSTNNHKSEGSVKRIEKELDYKNYKKDYTTIKEKRSWEFNLNNQLKRYIKKLKLSIDYFELAKKIYNDVLLYLKKDGSFNPFESFLSNFRVKQPKYFALSLIYCSMRKNSEKISQKSFMNNLNLNVSIIRETLPILYQILKKVHGYEFVYEIIRPQTFLEGEFKKVVKNYLDMYFNYLKSLNTVFNHKFNKNDNEQSNNILISGINSIISDNKFAVFYKSLKIKNPKIVAATLCLMQINYHNDLE